MKAPSRQVALASHTRWQERVDSDRRRGDCQGTGYHRSGEHLERLQHSIIQRAEGGAFTVDFRDPHHGIVGGGDLDAGNPNNARTAISSDGGRTWTLTSPPPVTGAIFGLSYVGKTGRGGGNNLGRAVVITANDPPTFSTGAVPGLRMREIPGSRCPVWAVSGR